MPLSYSTYAARPGPGKIRAVKLGAFFYQYYESAHAQINFCAGNLKARVMVGDLGLLYQTSLVCVAPDNQTAVKRSTGTFYLNCVFKSQAYTLAVHRVQSAVNQAALLCSLAYHSFPFFLSIFFL